MGNPSDLHVRKHHLRLCAQMAHTKQKKQKKHQQQKGGGVRRCHFNMYNSSQPLFRLECTTHPLHTHLSSW